MRADILFREYIWLVETIKRAGKISLEEINRKWVDNRYLSDGDPISRSTFVRHKEAIENIFGITIGCDPAANYGYFIENVDTLEDDSLQSWMLSTLSVNNTLAESKSVADRILLEHIPSDGEFLHQIIQAMKSNLRIDIVYRKFGSDHDSTMKVDPFFVKLFNRRWYVIGRHSEKGFLFPLALDRIKELEVTQEDFIFPEDFSPSVFMKEQYGVLIADDMEPKRVVIRAFGKEADYMRSLPLHSSQREIDRQDGWSDFELRLRVTYDLTTPLLARGANIRVLEPDFLAEELMYAHDDAVRLYTDQFELLEPETAS